MGIRMNNSLMIRFDLVVWLVKVHL